MRCIVNPPLSISLRVRGTRASIKSAKYPKHGIYEQEHCRNPYFSCCYSDLRARTAINDGRARLSILWVPSSGGIKSTADEDSHSKLIRAGFLRQAHSGIFHMLPLGRRVQDKLESLIDKYMSKLNASKLSLSSITSEELWTKSGRMSGAGSELFRFKDRKDARYLLAPTHEEEITALVSSTKPSYKNFPLRLYQISRKYRDEKRPRQGLLRSREFIMKDLYTFDYSEPLALETYYSVRDIYKQLFDELKIPYLVADADSGSIGGDLSHEFHFPTSIGEDHIISCNSCDYMANEELAEAATPRASDLSQDNSIHANAETPASTDDLALPAGVQVWRGISKDRNTLINVWYSTDPVHSASSAASEVNIYTVKSIVPELDPSIEDPLSLWRNRASETLLNARHTSKDTPQIVNLFDFRVPGQVRAKLESEDSRDLLWPEGVEPPFGEVRYVFLPDTVTSHPINLTRIRDGDSCSRCTSGKLKVQKAIELGHTFHLGTRYSEPLKATVAVPSNLLKDEAVGSTSDQRPMQMGCHGIGVSRIMGAVADVLADKKGLNWPRVMAPFEVVVISVDGLEQGALDVYDQVACHPQGGHLQPLDVILDDRAKPFAWKIRDADLAGYPIIVVLGRRWEKERVCEIQCRRLQLREDVAVAELPGFLEGLLAQL